MFFDARAVLAEILQNERGASATSATPATQTAETAPRVAVVASVAGRQVQNPDFERSPVATPATPATPTPEIRPVSQMSQVSQGVLAKNRKLAAARAMPVHAPTPSARDTPKPGCMVRLAWSGEWVSADRYAEMTDLERHGPQGRLFCGRCEQYRDPATALGCMNGEGCQ